jgi:hypothetical protein
MSQRARVEKLAGLLWPEKPLMQFRICPAAKGGSTEGHARWHAERGEQCFTLKLGESKMESEE